MKQIHRFWEDDAYLHQRLMYDADAYDTDKLVFAIVTGYGAGKTHAFVRKMFQLAVDNAPIPVVCVEPTYPMISDILVPAFEELFDGAGIAYTYNQQRKEITIPSLTIDGVKYRCGARIWMRSGDNPARLKGPNIAAAGIDEPFIQERDVYKQMTARVRHPKARNKMIILAGTPEGMGWGYDVLVDASKHVDTLTAHVKGRAINVEVYEGDRLKWVSCSSEINASLDDSYFDDIRKTHTDLEAGAYIDGRFQNLAQGRVYYAYERGENDAPCELNYSVPVLVACDFNTSECPMSWNVFQYIDGQVRVRYALHKAFTNTERMCEHLRDVLTAHGGMPPQLTFYGDYSGNKDTSNSIVSDWEIIRRYFNSLTRVEVLTRPCKSIRGSASAVNALLCNANKERRLFLHPGEDTDHLRKDFELVAWREGGTKEDDRDKNRTHAGAAMRYYAEYEHPIRHAITRRIL